MSSVLPGLRDRHRNYRNGRRKYVGQVLLFDTKWTVIAEVYGWTLREMRARKMAVAKALKDLNGKAR